MKKLCVLFLSLYSCVSGLTTEKFYSMSNYKKILEVQEKRGYFDICPTPYCLKYFENNLGTLALNKLEQKIQTKGVERFFDSAYYEELVAVFMLEYNFKTNKLSGKIYERGNFGSFLKSIINSKNRQRIAEASSYVYYSRLKVDEIFFFCEELKYKSKSCRSPLYGYNDEKLSNFYITDNPEFYKDLVDNLRDMEILYTLKAIEKKLNKQEPEVKNFWKE
jgi:hypothetical protein